MANMLCEKVKVFIRKKKKFLSMLFLLSITFLIYSNSFYNEFTNWDDDDLIIKNTAIRELSWENIKKIFDIKKGGTYQPVRVLSYAIDYRMWRLNPLGYHIHSILLHALSSIFLFLSLLNALPRLFVKERENIWGIALLTAVLFAVHPVNVEAVSWLSCRKYVLLSFFSFAGFYFFTLTSEQQWKRVLLNLLSLSCALLAVFSSPFGVVVPALFFLFEFSAYDEVNPVKIILKKPGVFIPFAVLTLCVSILLWIKLAAGATGAETFHFKGDLIYSIFTLMQGLFDYFRNIFSPFWLNNRYVDYIYLSSFDYYKIPVGFFGLCLVLGFCFYKFRQGKRLWFFSIGWFLISLAPASNIIPISTKMADRYIYLAVPGLFLLLSYYLFRIKQQVAEKRNLKFLWYLSLVFMVVFFSTLSVQRNLIWKNSGTLWTDSLKKDLRNPIAWNNLGSYYFSKGDVKKSEFCFKQAIKLNSKGKQQYENLGYLLLNQKRLEEAIDVYKKIIDLDAADFLGYTALGEIYLLLEKPDLAFKYIDKVSNMQPSNPKAIAQKGNLFFALGSEKEAIIMYNKALDLYPDSAEIFFNKGLCYQKIEQYDDAVEAFLNALELVPNYAEAFNNLGEVYLKQGYLKQAEFNFKKAISNNAGLYNAYNNLGNLYVKQNRFNEALEEYDRALEKRPEFINALYNRCVVMTKSGSAAKAEACYQKIVDKYPGHAESWNNLGSLYAATEQYQHAAAMYKNALKNKTDFVDAHYNFAKMMSLFGSFDEAILHYKIILDHQPNNVDALNGVAFAYNALGEINPALHHFMRLLKLYPNRSSIYFNIGILLAKIGHTADAVSYLKKAVAIDPNNKMAIKILEQTKPIKK
jgi:protein O-mannosyl-transferase